MNTSSLERWVPLTGLVSVVLLIIGTVIIGIYDFLPPADKIAATFAANPNIQWGGYLGALSAFFLLWFAGCIRSAVYSEHVGHERLAATAFGGAVASAVAIGIASILLTTAAERAGSSGGISPEQAATMYDMYGAIMGGTVALTLSALVGAVGMAAIRKIAFPTWFGWVSVVVALGLISPISYIVAALAMLWIAVVSVWIFVKHRPT